ncbi:MAG: LapA family protein [Actinomycetota bacterium]
MTTTGDNGPASQPPSRRALADDLRSIEKRRPFRWGLLVGALATVAAALLIVQNGHSTGVRWLWFSFEMPQWLLLVVTLVIGGVVWEAAKLAWHRARSRAADRQQTLATARRRLGRS